MRELKGLWDIVCIPAYIVQRSHDLSDSARWLVVVLIYHRDYYTDQKQGVPVPSVAKLQELTGWSRAKVKKALKELQNADWIGKEADV
jgi:DNA-binding MarR family transcriptional regulator